MVKAVLEAMSVYWMALTWIPHGILDKIRKICLSFLWSSIKDKKTIPWVKWDCIALPQSLGGWGLKNIFLFSRALVAKYGWCLIRSSSLWTEVVWHKYIAPTPLTEWVRNSIGRAGGISTIWKAVLDSMDIIYGGLAWKIGNNNRFRIGIHPWPGSNRNHILSNALVECLDLDNLRFLLDVRDEGSTSFFSKVWKMGLMLGLSVDHSREWDLFVEALQKVHIRLSEEDRLVWDKSSDGKYNPKAGYSIICTDPFI